MVGQWVIRWFAHVGGSRPVDRRALGMAMLRRPGFVGTMRAIVDVDVDQWLVRREEEKKVCLIGIAWTEQDFSAGSGTTFIFILAPDTTLHPAQECTFLVESNAQTLMLGRVKLGLWDLSSVSRPASRTSYRLTRSGMRLTLQPYLSRHCERLCLLCCVAASRTGAIKGSKSWVRDTSSAEGNSR